MIFNNNICYRIVKTVTYSFAVEATKDYSSPHLDEKENSCGRIVSMQWTMHDKYGERKYLTSAEIDRFLYFAEKQSISAFSFCWVMAMTGCRISEALSLTSRNVDFEAQVIIIESLKKRGKRVFRAIPVPAALVTRLRMWLSDGTLPEGRLWPWSRMTGYRRICEVMRGAGIVGGHATPKGLRHGFGVKAVQSHVPLNLVQRWLGHADMKTTAIYTSVTGPEERDIASRMWSNSESASRSVPFRTIDYPAIPAFSGRR